MQFGKQFIVGFEGKELTKAIAFKLKRLNPAGIIIFDTNIESKEQVKTLITNLKQLLGPQLIISTDQEGGKVQRLRKITSPLVSLEALGKYSSDQGRLNKLPFTRQALIEHASLLAKELLELGFNFVYSPCADLNTNPQNPIIGQRSLGTDHKIISEQLKVIIETYKEHGLASCAKHFPGHGDTSKDSHLDLPIVNRTVEENLKHLYPFIQAISSEVDAIMVAHLICKIEHFNNLDANAINESEINPEELENLELKDISELQDNDLPASISPHIITEELRNSLAYKGLIISDEITMKALSQFGNYFEIAKKMLLAGNDIIVWNSNLDEAIEVADALNKEEGSDLIKRHQDSIKRIADFTEKFSKPKNISKTLSENFQLAIAQNVIEQMKPVPEKIDYYQRHQFKVIINKHPKLEYDLIDEIFETEIIFSDNPEKLNDSEKYLLIEFQINKDELSQVFEKVNRENLLICSADYNNSSTELNLHGSGEAHFIALRRFLSLTL